jgi:hypothetical protein
MGRTDFASERVEYNINSSVPRHSHNTLEERKISTREDVIFGDAVFIHEKLEKVRNPCDAAFNKS